MKRYLPLIAVIYPSPSNFNISLLIFRVVLSLELMIVHGYHNIGVEVEQVKPFSNTIHIPIALNDFITITANVICPMLVILGLCTRLAIIPILAVTLTNYFVLQWKDVLQIKDVPFMYSLSYLLLIFIGPGKYSVDYFIRKKK